MRIAQIAPLAESCPPRLYGGTERIVSYLTEELVRRGHDVTLFASGDSRTSARLVPCSKASLRLDPTVTDPLPHHMLMLEKVRRMAGRFDILHFHTDLLHFPLVRSLARPTITTLHGRLDLPELAPLYREFDDIPLVSVSDAQRQPMPPVEWVGTVHNGLPRDLLPFTAEPDGGYLAFLGRISPKKRPDRAIEIAARAGLPLKIAAMIDHAKPAYWNDVVRPMIEAHAGVEYIGEIGETQKGNFLGNAKALLFPIDWPEPFGLVMIEAMACGTPVIAYGMGAAPEVIEDGVSGFLVNDIEQAMEAVRKVDRLDRAAVRAAFEQRFTAERMVDRYLCAYRSAGAEPHVLATA
jgi:glycosyltransferase involved in cell wall biosynthesis